MSSATLPDTGARPERGESLRAEIAMTRGDLVLDAAIDVPPGPVTALVGPNGAGKTTFVLALAGLVQPDRAYIAVGDRVIEDTASGRRLPPERRGIGVVFQDHRLFAHMSVVDNVAFGLRARGLSRRAAAAPAQAWLERVGLAGRAHQRAGGLSGGEAQRAALGRALVTEPRVLLLDEPLASVDAAAKADLRHLLRTELVRSPGVRIVITHDPLEAAALADHLVVLEGGQVTQQGPLVDVTGHPRTPWIAAMVGLNLARGVADGAAVRVASGATVAIASTVQGPALVAFRPNAVTLHRQPPAGSSTRNVWPGTAAELFLAGDRMRVRVEGPVPLIAEVTPAAASELALADGGAVWATVKATDTEAYPA